jgi:RimJ/RimL family protein N-acetyltransferase
MVKLIVFLQRYGHEIMHQKTEYRVRFEDFGKKQYLCRKNESVMKTEFAMETERLLLRPWRESDAKALYKYASDPEVGPRAGWPPHKSVAESREIIRTIFNNDHTWAIELKATNVVIGCIGYYVCGESNISIGENDVEAGYWVARPFWNRGICTEALRLLIDYCFREKGYSAIWSDFFMNNPASGRVMEKCDFRDTGKINWCSHLYHGDDSPVRIMILESTKVV